jgi:hypothetical protein
MRFNSSPAVLWKLLLAVLVLSLAACSMPGAKTAVEPTTSNAPTLTPAPLVMSTPTLPSSRVVLLAPSDADPALMQAVQTLLSGASKKQGYQLDTLQALQPKDVSPQTRLVVILTIVPNLSDLLTAAPKTQFLVVSPVDLGAGANLSVIRLTTENRGFAAGYLGMIAAADWRLGALIPAENPLGAVLEDTFRSGAGYYCGVCNSVGQPVERFPKVWRVTSGSDPAALQPVIDQMKKLGINTVYVGGGVATPQVLAALADQNFNLLGDSPPPQAVQAHWVASLNYDALGAVQSTLPDLLNGKGGKVVNPDMTMSNINGSLLSPARLELVQKTLKDLQNGMIYPFQVPGQ